MRILPTLVFAGVVSASAPQVARRSSSFMALKGIMERQLDFCEEVPAPATCERSCGPGYAQCVEPLNCYNYARGDICCSDGTYCFGDEFCTDNGCCPEGYSLEECGATVTLTVIPPPPTDEPDPSTDLPDPTTTDETTSEAEPTTAPPTTDVSPTTTTPPPTPPPHGINTTTPSPPPQVTGGADKNAQYGAVAAMGVLGALLLPF